MGTVCMGSIVRSLLFLTLAFTFTMVQCLRPDVVTDTLMQGDNLTVGNLSSPSNVFHLSFFTINDTKDERIYLGINYLKGCLWLADPNIPLFERQARLIVDDYGSLKILSNNDTELLVLYSSKAAQKINASGTLLDTGNFVLREMDADGNAKQILWQSYDYPTFLLLPGMKLGFNKRTGQNWSLTSWTGKNTPAKGSFTLGVDQNNKQLVIWRHGNLYWTSGPLFDGSFPNLNTSSTYKIYFSYVSNENETYFSYKSTSPSTWNDLDFVGLDPRGQIYGKAFVSCCKDNPARVRGCVPQRFPTCRKQNAYVSMLNFKYGNMSQEGYKNEDLDKISLYDCGATCMNSCSCFAYSFTTHDKTGCQMWNTETKFVMSSTGQQVYFINELITGNDPSIHRKFEVNKREVWIGSVIGGALLILVSPFMFYVLWRKHRIAEERLKQKKILYEIEGITEPSSLNNRPTKVNKIETINHGMHVFSFGSIELATDHFSSANKLGEGGFGPVYKGQLLDGREIAIKRLSRSSTQGLPEFKNEVQLIAKFNHTNLVKLYGFCIEKEERMLIYEYMPNKSLDFYLFDSNNTLLDWKRRFSIVQGIAQGLVYLHTYSRLTVIHRDLKPSNILLDYEMNPKISDFGLARIFELKEQKKNTNKVVGTYGYMSPEYALNGIVSTKIDVFSFGVLMLEIISGKKNSIHFDWNHPTSLIGHAWQMWNMDDALELIDPILKGSCVVNEVLRCIHVSLLCVQDQADDRPTMSDVVSFLSSESLLAEPKQPTFFTNTGVNEPKSPIAGERSDSLNIVTISTLGGR